jgi:DNA primase catalytic subunit
MVRKEILGTSERRILVAYLNGERLKDYTVLLHRIRKMGLREIIQGCERDLELLRKLLKLEATKH